MKLSVALVSLFALTSSLNAQEPMSESWQTGYTGADATGPAVLGYWPFRPGAVTSDASGKGHTLTLSGAGAAEQGKFDGALQSAAGWPVADKRHAAIAKPHASLSPKGAFTLELWVKADAGLTREVSPVLVDKKYVAHTDYQFRLTAADKGGARRMQVSLGFGEESETFASENFAVAVGEWQHLAFTYDGAGTVRFFRNGAPQGVITKPGRGPITPGKTTFSIGDRVGSYYAGFPGLLDEVRLCNGALEFRPISVEFRSERWTWQRIEKAAPIRLAVRNLTKASMSGLKLSATVAGLGEKSFAVPTLAAGATYEVAYPIDTTLRPDTYTLTARLELTGPMPFTSMETAEFVIAGRSPARMPVLMWGINGPDNVIRELPRLKDLGFTHCLGGGADYGAIWDAGKPIAPAQESRMADTRRMLDTALANNFGIAFSLSPGHWLKDRSQLQRVDRSGKPNTSRPDVNAALPGLAEFCFNVGASIAQAYRGFPAWQATLINSETRDSSQLSFSPADHEAYRKFAGAEIPPEVTIKSGVDWKKLKDFPADRIIPDDHPVRAYYRWFWAVGDGWNALHSAVHRGAHSTGRDDMWTWFDPAIRAASIAGSGGSVDVLGQWTYTNPDPLRVGYFADQLLAMAANAPQPQRAMKMTQLFWYRSQSAPQRAGAAAIPSPFDDHDPDAAYITISPMHLREAFWTKIARPVSGIMYHGWQALVPTESTSGYRYTHPDTKEEFRRLHRGVLEPLGPTLLQLADRRSDVAYLDSFTAQMFARRGSYGYSSDEAYLTLLHAQLQPEVIHEDQLLQRGLDGYKVLVLADCDVLPLSVANRIREFQKHGGLVIGDGNLAPGIRADISLMKFTRMKKAAEDHAAILANAARLRAALDAKYTRFAESSNPEVVVRCRQAGASDYVFVVNDHREAGTYVGQHGLVLDNGAPAEAELSVQRTRGHVYDIVSGQEIAAANRDGKLRWTVNLGPCDGRAFLISPTPIAAIAIEAADTAVPGKAIDITFKVTDATGAAIPAVVPLKVEIADPAGRFAEFSGHYAARDGQLTVHFDFAPNDAPGVWSIRARELASGQTAQHYLRLTQP